MSKYKLNWGWSIFLVYASFVIVFLFFFYKSFIELESNELVTDNYYQKELVYGDVLAKKKNADTMRIPVSISHIQNGLLISFPKYIDAVKGNIFLYRPNNQKLDQNIDIHLNEAKQQIIVKEKLPEGYWRISIDWTIQNTPYFMEKKLYVN